LERLKRLLRWRKTLNKLYNEKHSKRKAFGNNFYFKTPVIGET
jgi:hypothetical protein